MEAAMRRLVNGVVACLIVATWAGAARADDSPPSEAKPTSCSWLQDGDPCHRGQSGGFRSQEICGVCRCTRSPCTTPICTEEHTCTEEDGIGCNAMGVVPSALATAIGLALVWFSRRRRQRSHQTS